MKLELYHFDACPYCRKVRNYIEMHGLESKITYYDVRKDPDAMDRLVDLNHDEQVPCLVVDGDPILESADIIEWLEENLVEK